MMARDTRVLGRSERECHVARHRDAAPPERARSAMPIDGILLGRDTAVDLLEALDLLATLAKQRGARLPGRIAALRHDLAEIGSRADSRASVRKVTEELESAHHELGLVDVATAAERLGITKDGVRDLCRREKLAAMRPGGRRWWIDEHAIVKRLNERGAGDGQTGTADDADQSGTAAGGPYVR